MFVTIHFINQKSDKNLVNMLWNAKTVIQLIQTGKGLRSDNLLL